MKTLKSNSVKVNTTKKLSNTEIVIATKKVVMNLGQRKEALTSKENKSTFDYVKLANVLDKLENKTASKVYKNCIANSEISNIIGTDKIPSFALFIAKLPIKENYSNWDGYKCFAKFNIKNELAKKVIRQNTGEAKK